MVNFISLHTHTNLGSPYDALGSPKEWVDAAVNLGMETLAITEHGNMNSLAEFVLTSQEHEKAGKVFKPIYGVEFYVIKNLENWIKRKEIHDSHTATASKKKVPNPVNIAELRATSHLAVWAKNLVGLQNLYKLVSLSHSDSYYYRKPRIDLPTLIKYREGLMGCNACMGGVLGNLVRTSTDAGKSRFEIENDIDRTNGYMRDIFGQDSWYNEVQWNGFEDQHRLNLYVLGSAKRLDIPVITTVDSHYITPDLWKHREFYYAMKYLRGEEEEKMEIPTNFSDIKMDLSLKTMDQVWESFEFYSKNYDYSAYDIRATMERTQEVADKVEKFYPDQSPKMPSFIMDQYKKGPIEEISDMCGSELVKKGLDNEVYQARLKIELEVIKTRGFARYFLVMKEIVSQAKSKWLTGAARGSAAGSLVSYLLGITQVDPIRFNLSFSRFLTMDAIGYPDIDFDVADPAGLKQMLIEKWGVEKLAFVSNWNMLKFNNLVKDIGKFFDLPFQEINEMTKAASRETIEALQEAGVDIPKVYSPSYEEIKTHSYMAQRFFKKYPFVDEFIGVLSGQVRDVSTHAGGIIVGDDLTKSLPLISVKGKFQTPWPEGQNKRMLEPMGFIKFDVLGISTLQVIQRAIEKVLVQKGIEPSFENVTDWYNSNLHPEKINFNDQRVYKYVFEQGHWAGVFQFSQEGAQNFCVKSEPHSLTDLSIITSIYRPGPLGAGVDKLFLGRKAGRDDDEYVIDNPWFNEVTKDTYGFIVFQEQISDLVSRLGEGISEDDGQKVRKLLTKKKGGDMEKLKPYVEKYYQGCENKGVAREDAEKMWDICVHFAAYGFNRSHALSYSMISFQSAYLTTYYPDLWIEALLDVEYELKGDTLIQELRKSGYQVLHLSDAGWKTSGWTCRSGKISPPTWVISGVSEDFSEELANQDFSELIDVWRWFVQKREKKLLSSFISCGVFDRLMKQSSHKGFIELIGKYKGQIYSQPHLFECIDMMALGTKEDDDLIGSIKYKEMTGILPVERVYPKEVLREASVNKIHSPSKILVADYGRGGSFSSYLVFVTDTVIKERWGKLIYIDESGQEEEVYVQNFSALEQIKKMNMYAIKLKRETRTSIKIQQAVAL